MAKSKNPFSVRGPAAAGHVMPTSIVIVVVVVVANLNSTRRLESDRRRSRLLHRTGLSADKFPCVPAKSLTFD